MESGMLNYRGCSSSSAPIAINAISVFLDHRCLKLCLVYSDKLHLCFQKILP
jgi:hypothetical protein